MDFHKMMEAPLLLLRGWGKKVNFNRRDEHRVFIGKVSLELHFHCQIFSGDSRRDDQLLDSSLASIQEKSFGMNNTKSRRKLFIYSKESYDIAQTMRVENFSPAKNFREFKNYSIK
jgi:hypothetical protein